MGRVAGQGMGSQAMNAWNWWLAVLLLGALLGWFQTIGIVTLAWVVCDMVERHGEG